MNKLLKIVLPIIICFAFVGIATSLLAKVVSDTVQKYLDQEPLSFERSGEDIPYEVWLKNYHETVSQRQKDLQNLSDKYDRELSQLIQKVSDNGDIYDWRESQ